MSSAEYEFENRHLKNITELFLDISNQFEIKNIIRNDENLNIQINNDTLYNWTNSKEFKYLANIADNNNLLLQLIDNNTMLPDEDVISYETIGYIGMTSDNNIIYDKFKCFKF